MVVDYLIGDKRKLFYFIDHGKYTILGVGYRLIYMNQTIDRWFKSSYKLFEISFVYIAYLSMNTFYNPNVID